MANPYKVVNVDSTFNKAEQITEYIRAYIKIGSHKTRQYLFITQLGNKEMMIGYSYLYKHNPTIDWQKGQWEFTRCLNTCAYKAHKTQDVEADANKLHLELDISRSPSLDNIGNKDPDNHILSWADTTDPGNYQQAMVIASLLNNQNQYGELDCEDTKA